MNILSEITTHDIVLAATLKVTGFKMTSLVKQGNKGLFTFVNVDANFLKEFDLGNVEVEPISFHAAVKALTTASRRVS